MKSDDKIRIQYASKQARMANYWKKWIGENQGIAKSNAIAKKRDFEATFTKAISKNKYKKYQTLLSDFDKLYDEFEPYAVKRSNFFEIFLRNSELMTTMFRLYQLEQSKARGEERFEKTRGFVKSQITRIQKDYNVNIDKGVFEAIMPLYDAKNSNSDFYETSSFTNLTDALKALEGYFR